MPAPTIETEALVRALAASAVNLPTAALQLRQGLMSSERQRELGAMLIELGELVRQHADISREPGEVVHQDTLCAPGRGIKRRDSL